MPVHHVDVEKIGAATLGGLDVPSEGRKIGGEQ
jgi:hypothetical protein